MIRKVIAVLLGCSCVCARTQAPMETLVLVKAGKLFDARNGERFETVVKFQGPAFQRALQHRLKIAFGLDDYPDYLDREFVAL